MSDTPPRKNRRSLLDRTTTPALPRRDVTRPDPTIPGFEGVIPDGVEPAEPMAMRRTATDEAPIEAPRPTLLPVDESADPVEPAPSEEIAPDDRARWALMVLVVAVALLGVGALGGASVSGLGFALMGGDARPEPVVVPVPVGIPEPSGDVGTAEEPEEPEEPEELEAPVAADPEAGEDEEKGLKIKLPKIKFGKKKQE